MNLRTTGALVLVAIALAAYVWLVEVRGGRERAEAEAVANRILDLRAEAITALELPLEGGGTVRVVRDTGGADRWTLESPVRYPADSGAVSGIVSTLTELDAKGTIEDPPEDLEPFGLVTAPSVVRVFLGEEEPRILRIGGKTPVGALSYVQREGDARLFTVEDWRMSTLRPRLVTLRDKRVVERDPSEVIGIKIWDRDRLIVRATSPGAGEQGGDRRWELVEPIRDQGDARRFQRVLDDLHFLRATDFIDEPGDLRAYGLHRPEIAIELEAEGARDQIELGRNEGKVYARTGQHSVVFQVSDRALADVPRELFPYRYKQVLELEEDDVARLELRFPRDDATYAFVRDQNTWKAEQEEVQIGSLRIEDMLYAIRDLEATGLEERSLDPATLGLAPAGVQITARDREGKELGWVELGDPSVEEGLAARSSGTADRIWRVANEIGKDIPLTLEAFRNNFLEKAPPPVEESEGTDPPGADGEPEPEG